MGSPCSVSPSFFMSHKALPDATKRESFRATVITSISSSSPSSPPASPSTVESRPLKDNFQFGRPPRKHGFLAVSKVSCPRNRVPWIVLFCVADKMPGQFAAALTEGRTPSVIKTFYFFLFPFSLFLFHSLSLYLSVERLTKIIWKLKL